MASRGGAIANRSGERKRNLTGASTSTIWIALRLGILLVSTIAFGWVLGLGVESLPGPGPAPFDAPVAEELSGWHSAPLTQGMKAITWLGNRGVVLTAMALISIALWAVGRRTGAALFLLSSVLGGYVVSSLVKATVQRVRPLEGLVHASGGSFPSGHSVASVTLYAGLAVVVWRWGGGNSAGEKPARARALAGGAWLAAVLLIVSIGVSRVYLGVHWPSDVVAGVILGSGWMAGCAGAWSRWERLHPGSPAKAEVETG